LSVVGHQETITLSEDTEVVASVDSFVLVEHQAEITLDVSVEVRAEHLTITVYPPDISLGPVFSEVVGGGSSKNVNHFNDVLQREDNEILEILTIAINSGII
jgi:hypothetical protein